jgi:DNA-binding IclR family transcriptional regulator
MTRGGETGSLLKSLHLLETVARGVHDLDGLGAATSLPRSTAHRLLSTLVRRGYLRHHAGSGYRLGPLLIELGFAAQDQLHLPSVARPHLERLARASAETVHLAVLEGRDVVYLDKLPAARGKAMIATIGARAPAQTTALGKVLVAGLPQHEWPGRFDPSVPGARNATRDEAAYFAGLRHCAQAGFAEDDEEHAPGVRCLAAPIRDATGGVSAAVSLSCAASAFTEPRRRELLTLVLGAAAAISAELGWRPRAVQITE